MQANKHKERIPSLLAINDLLSPIVRSYREIFTRARFSQVIFLLLSWQRSVIYTLFTSEPLHVDNTGSVTALHMADMLTPTISKIIAFAKSVSGFNSVSNFDLKEKQKES